MVVGFIGCAFRTNREAGAEASRHAGFCLAMRNLKRRQSPGAYLAEIMRRVNRIAPLMAIIRATVRRNSRQS